MDNVLTELFSLSTVILCVGLWIAVLVERRVTEFFWKTLKAKKVWNELILPLLPLANGLTFGLLATKYPYPEVFAGSMSGRVFFSVVCGLASAHVYRILKKFWQDREDGSVDVNLDDLK